MGYIFWLCWLDCFSFGALFDFLLFAVMVFGRFRLALRHSSGSLICLMILPFEWFLWSLCFVLDPSFAIVAELLLSR